jgi:hypothetical protein
MGRVRADGDGDGDGDRPCVRVCLRAARTTRRPILHRFANEDVSLGAWLVEHVDDRSLCCATPPGTHWSLGHLISPRLLRPCMWRPDGSVGFGS